MPVTLSQLAHRARANATASGVSLSLGRAQEVTAAVLGYNTFAAYQAAVAKGVEAQDLDGSQHFLPDHHRLATRLAALGLSADQGRIVAAVNDSFRSLLPHVRAHADESALFDHVRLDVEVKIADSAEFGSAQAETNTDGLPEMELEFLGNVGGIDAAEGSYTAEVEGTASLDHDPDRPATTNRINVKATVSLEKLGTRLLDSVQVVDVVANTDYEGYYD